MTSVSIKPEHWKTDGRFRRDIEADYPASFAALSTFGLPFLAYGRDGQRIHASEAAIALISAVVPESDAWAQLSTVVCSVLARQGAVSSPKRPSVPAVDGSYEIVVHVPDRYVPRIGAIILLHSIVPARVEFDLCRSGLTSREAQIARLIAQGHSAKAIATRLAISPHTVRRHTERVFSKLGVHSRASLGLILARSSDRSVAL